MSQKNGPNKTLYFYHQGQKIKYKREIWLGSRLYYVVKERGMSLKAFDSRLKKWCVIRFRESGVRNELRLGQIESLKYSTLPYVYDVGKYEGREYLIQDWIPGKDLHSYLQKGAPGHPYFDVDRSAFLFKGLVNALNKLHETGYCHGDIKPANIIVTPQIRLMLVDFGAAWNSALMRERPNEIDVIYAAPEKTDLSATVDMRSDQFSASVVFYQMLTGETPYDGFGGLAGKRRNTLKLIPPKELNKTVGRRLSDVVVRGLRLNIDDRYPTTRAWLDDLELAAPNMDRFQYNQTSIVAAWDHLKSFVADFLVQRKKHPEE